MSTTTTTSTFPDLETPFLNAHYLTGSVERSRCCAVKVERVPCGFTTSELRTRRATYRGAASDGETTRVCRPGRHYLTHVPFSAAAHRASWRKQKSSWHSRAGKDASAGAERWLDSRVGEAVAAEEGDMSGETSAPRLSLRVFPLFFLLGCTACEKFTIPCQGSGPGTAMSPNTDNNEISRSFAWQTLRESCKYHTCRKSAIAATNIGGALVM